MTALERHLEDYLAIRRGLGFKLVNEQRALRRFVEFMDDVGEPTVTIELALRWATLPAGVGHAYLSQRMRAVRGFARYLHGIDPSSEESSSGSWCSAGSSVRRLVPQAALRAGTSLLFSR